MRILAYCLMDNHYHLVLQNLTGRMSEFFKQLNGQFGTYYRQRYGGKGYIFQDRYKSQLIQDDAYLMLAIAYVLNNPVKAGLARSYEQFPWSSGGLYFTDKSDQTMVDSAYVNDLFGNQKEFKRFVISLQDLEELPMVKSEIGLIIGGAEFIEKAEVMADRRSGLESTQMRRLDDRYFEPLEKVIQEFEAKHGVKIVELNTRTHTGKRLRTELMVSLKDMAGLRYVDILQLEAFSGLSLGGLGCNYRDYKMKTKKQ